jgi:hypothetical protein
MQLEREHMCATSLDARSQSCKRRKRLFVRHGQSCSKENRTRKKKPHPGCVRALENLLISFVSESGRACSFGSYLSGFTRMLHHGERPPSHPLVQPGSGCNRLSQRIASAVRHPDKHLSNEA